MTSSGTHQFKLKEVTQIGFVVRDVEKVAEAWTSMFGIGPWKFRYIEGTEAKGRYQGRFHKERLAQAQLGTLNIELVQPIEGRAVHAEFLDKVGEGLQHIQVRTDDVEGEAANLAAQGAEFVLSFPGGAAYMGNLPGGLVLEIVGNRPSQGLK
jgi:methylmalonyl-CoA/ethylmalonyl-CoA epimerase